MPITEQNLKAILEYAKANADLFMVLLGENCDHAFQRDLMDMVELVPFQYNAPENQKKYILNFAVTGCVSTLYRWLTEGTVESPEEMAELVLKIIYRGLLGL